MVVVLARPREVECDGARCAEAVDGGGDDSAGVARAFAAGEESWEGRMLA